jgi:hypothetical protein
MEPYHPRLQEVELSNSNLETQPSAPTRMPQQVHTRTLTLWPGFESLLGNHKSRRAITARKADKQDWLTTRGTSPVLQVG